MDELDDLTWPSSCAYMCEVYNYTNNVKKCRHLDPELLERMPYPNPSLLVPATKPAMAATGRPRRERKAAQKAKSPHSLVALLPDVTTVTCAVSKDTLVLMNLHGFLCHSEVIGWLGGSVNGDLVTVAGAFPVREIGNTENPNINVEMDIEDAFDVKETMQQQGLAIVGWYHSHPTFENTPSIVDIENQQNHQKTSMDRFIGAIVSPYWSNSSTLAQLCTFTVEEDNEHFITYEHQPPCEVKSVIYGEANIPQLLSKANGLLHQYANHPRRTHFKNTWKRGISYEDKFRLGLEQLVNHEFANSVASLLHEIWGEDTEPQKVKRPKTSHRA